jgi:hypothetical protein
MVAVWLLVVLRWREPEAASSMASTSPLIKLIRGSRGLSGEVMRLPLSSQRGGGEEEELRCGVVLCRSTEREGLETTTIFWSSSLVASHWSPRHLYGGFAGQRRRGRGGGLLL